MKKQELIAEYERVSNFVETVKTKSVIDKLKQLDEPKVQVPKFIADWIKKCKEESIVPLAGAFEYGNAELESYLSDWRNQETFARAWLDGYEVEKEKRYYVRLKGVDENYNYLNRIKHLDAWCLAEIKTDKKFRTTHTRKELEDADFGWVFDCPGMEVEEEQEDE